MLTLKCRLLSKDPTPEMEDRWNLDGLNDMGTQKEKLFVASIWSS